MDSPEKQYQDIQSWNVSQIVTALNKVQQTVKRAEKDGVNKHFGYAYVSEEGLVDQCRDAFIENGLLLTPTVSDKEFHVEHGLGDHENMHMVVWQQGFHLAHISGALWPYPIMVMCEGADSGDKSVWKGLTNAHKHVLLKLLMLPTGEDPEADDSVDEAFESQGRLQHSSGQGTTPPRGAPAASGGSRLPAPGKHRGGGGAPSIVSVKAAQKWMEEVGQDYEMTTEDFKNWKIWGSGFKAVEAVYGKDLPEGISKFACMDDFKAEESLGKGSAFCAYHLVRWIDYCTTGWHAFEQHEASEEPLKTESPF